MTTGVPASAPRRTSIGGERRASNSGATLSVRQIAGRIAVCGLIAGLGLFHALLLWQRIASFTLLEPLVALRWSAAALLGLAFAYLHRSGISVVWGHRAVTLWLLVLLLHAGMVPSTVGQTQLLAEPVLIALSLCGIVLYVVFQRLVRRWGAVTLRSPRLRPRRGPIGPTVEPGFFEPLSPRPPPV